jgi:hypothetical protein
MILIDIAFLLVRLGSSQTFVTAARADDGDRRFWRAGEP